MSAFSWLRGRTRTLGSAAIVTVSAVAITTLAFVYEGRPTTEVDLHDGGVWITKRSSLLVGHFNHESKVLDGGVRTTSENYDILQSGSTVIVVDEENSSIATVDPARVNLAETTNVPGGAQLALGGGAVSIIDPTDGALWATDAESVGTFAAGAVDPLDELGAGAVATAGLDGRIYAASPESGELVTYARDDQAGETIEVARRGLEGVEASSQLTITAVGDRAYALDVSTGTLYGSDGSRVEVPGGRTAVLQHPSAGTDAVTLATADALVRIPTGGGEPIVVRAGAEGVPAAPVYLGGCAYGAWGGSARFIRDCVSDADDLEAAIDGVDTTAELTFRVNRDVVVLNDVIGGAAWMATESLQRVDNWNDVMPPEGEAEEDEQTTEETVETTLPERSDVNTPPIAVDDEFGVRPGRTTVLPILDNDSDADGDVLVATVEGSGPSLGTVQQIYNGAALQIAVPADASGTDTFTYRVEDGRGGEDTARVTLTVRGENQNAPPRQNRITAVTVESGGTVSYNVLPDWIDPDGDDIFLKSVVTTDGDEADFTSDGQITFRAIGGTQGRKDVEIVVSDGRDDTVGTVRFDVRPIGSTMPVANADHVVTRVGQSVTVSPLANDVSSGREPLRLTRVDDVDGARITPDFANKTFSFVSDAPQTYYVQYLVSAGPNSVAGIVRVDVLPDADTDLPPIAVRDVALLPRGGEVLVNVLANDSDPAGGVLVVQSVSVEPDSGVSVAVLGHETLRITDQSALDRQVRIGYRISNGAQSAQGEVIVIPVPSPAQLRPPVARDDQVVVRAGDIVTIPVLENDYHPNGDTMHVAPDLIPPLISEDDGEIFVSEDTLRFRAGETAKTVYATYEVVDSAGQRDAGYVTIQILPVNEDGNAAPRPRDLTARVLSGTSVRIAVPLDGIDEDGDSVELVGIASAPRKGRVSETGSNYFEYEALEGSTGLDTFSYRVRDRLGAEGTATIRVGIAPAETTNQAPYAMPDAVIMRPGREVAVPVMQNDSDPDGDAIALVSDGLVVPDVDGLSARVSGDRVVITAPDRPVETSVQYTIVDARGLTARSVVQITVAEDVPLLPPIARDDRVRAEDVADEGFVDVEVLANDEDPDGVTADLDVATNDAGASVRGDKRIRVTLGDAPQIVRYTVTDRDGLQASAFIHVPALGGIPPTLVAGAGVEVVSGETIEIPLAEHVRAGAGKSVVITEAGKVSSVHGDGSSLVQDQRTLVYTSQQGYSGQDSITFEVTDGTGPDDPDGIKATLSLPVTVLPAANQPPTFTGAEMNVAPGEDPSTLDLRALSSDPDPGDLERLEFSLAGGSPRGIDVSIDGDQLRVSAPTSTAKGTTGQVRIQVTDGQSDPVEGTVSVRVTASTRFLASANDDTIAEADQGQPILVDVLANDVNPFPETPLRIVAASTETGAGRSEVVGDQVRVTPDATFVGTMVVRYRIQDATEDPDREVEGRIRLTVQGKPDAPGRPTVTSVQDRTVVMSWTPPVDNGTRITGYTVRSTAGSYTKECPSTTCTLDGLTNNVEYNFVVTATNRVGESDPSVPSETARPDARPDTPQAPTLAFGDRSLQVSWVTPPTPGSPVETFSLEISPAPPSGVSQKAGVTGNSIVWDGLENGASYQVRVRAHNRAPEPSSWSAWSAAEIPAAPPAAPGAPSTQRVDSVGSQAQLQVSWTPPAANGAAIDLYQVRVHRGGGVQQTLDVPAGQTSQNFTVDTSTSDYTFSVRARNKASWGEWSAQSAPRRAFTPPGAPTAVSASEGDNQVGVTWGAAPGNGANANEIRYEYSVSGGSWRADWIQGGGNGATSGRIGNGAVPNNGAYTIRVRGVATADGSTYTGEASAASNEVRPYGAPRTPGAGARASGTNITFSWSPPSANGRPITAIEYRIDGGGWTSVAASDGSVTRGFGHAETHSITVRAVDSTGARSGEASASARTADPPPPPSARTVRGSARPDAGCNVGCYNVAVETSANFPAGNYRIDCVANGRAFNDWKGPYYIAAGGRTEFQCYYGFPGHTVYVDINGWGRADSMTW